MPVAYPELGGPGGRMYRNGEQLQHPSGAVYQRIDGHWVVIERPKEAPGDSQ